ncbi:MAG: hypothetical protein AAFZ58_08760 [Pseudomonadota bacterium]
MASHRHRQRRRYVSVFGTALVLGFASGTVADDIPDADFLEYLGSWDNEDEEAEWILVAEETSGDATATEERREAKATRSEQDEVTYEQ